MDAASCRIPRVSETAPSDSEHRKMAKSLDPRPDIRVI
jgi:hypothetical protein